MWSGTPCQLHSAHSFSIEPLLFYFIIFGQLVDSDTSDIFQYHMVVLVALISILSVTYTKISDILRYVTLCKTMFVVSLCPVETWVSIKVECVKLFPHCVFLRSTSFSLPNTRTIVSGGLFGLEAEAQSLTLRRHEAQRSPGRAISANKATMSLAGLY